MHRKANENKRYLKAFYRYILMNTKQCLMLIYYLPRFNIQAVCLLYKAFEMNTSEV